jgi:trimeric autotransporter adhesin
MNPLIQCKTTILQLLIAGVLACFAISPMAKAVVPAPDGGYAGGNTAEGQAALLSLTTGGFNTAVGFFSLRSDTIASFNTAIGAGTLLANTADGNTAVGAAALLSNTTGTGNTATGLSALGNNTTGIDNTANGYGALQNNTGSFNTANGSQALFFNTTGSGNTANGVDALLNNTTGSDNTATGLLALFSNTTGVANTATGDAALFGNTTGGGNTANGYRALESNIDGIRNTANGVFALNQSTSGGGNTAIGYQALANNTADNNTATGNDSLVNNTTGSGNVAIGAGAGSGIITSNNVICIGTGGADVSNSCFIGNIHGVTTAIPDAIPVLIDSAGQLGTVSSSRRFKSEIKPMDRGSEAILALKPVTFHYKSDASGTSQFGLIAEEVAAVNPDLVVRDKNGEIYTVRYDAVNAMLLNEFLKEHRKVEQLTKDFEAKLGEQQKQIEALTAGLQKVSAQIELRKAVGQTALNNP